MQQADSTRRGAIPPGALLALGAAVMAAHLLLIEKAPLAAPEAAPLGTYVFSTRTLRPPAPEPQPTPAPQPKPSAALRPPAAAAPPEPAAPTATLRPAAASTEQAPAPPAPPPAIAEAPAAVASAPVAAIAPPAPVASVPAAPVPLVVASAPAVAAPASAPTVAAAAAPAPAAPPARDSKLEARTYAIPGSVRLKFNASGENRRQPLQASGELLWQHDGRNYETRMEIGAFGLGARALSSAGELTADGLAPRRFADKYRSELAAHFDRDRGRIVFSANSPPATLQPGAQDRLSIFIQLAAMVAGEPHRFTPGTTVGLQTASARAAETWVFTVEAPEVLTLPGGRLATLKLVRQPGKDYDQKIELWLAPELSYLPARIRVSSPNGDFVDQQWRTSAAP